MYAIPLQFIQGLPLHCTIVHLAMINVFIALNLWRHKLQGRTVVIHCGNKAVVNSISSGRSWFVGRGEKHMARREIQLPTILSSKSFISPARKTLLQTRCRSGMGAGYQGKWLADCYYYHGVK